MVTFRLDYETASVVRFKLLAAAEDSLDVWLYFRHQRELGPLAFYPEEDDFDSGKSSAETATACANAALVICKAQAQSEPRIQPRRRV